jgi:hypothetical protein
MVLTSEPPTVNFVALRDSLELLNVLSEDLDVSSQSEDSTRSQKKSNIIEQLAKKEKELQYTPKDKTTEGGDHSSYHIHWNKSVNEWVGY